MIVFSIIVIWLLGFLLYFVKILVFYFLKMLGFRRRIEEIQRKVDKVLGKFIEENRGIEGGRIKISRLSQ